MTIHCRCSWFTVAAALLVLAVLTSAPVVRAQSQGADQNEGLSADNEPLTAAFGQFPPYTYLDADGNRTGFSFELAEMLGEALGVAIDYVEFDSPSTFVQGLVDGQAHMFPGVARLPALEETAVFSDIVATESLRLMTTTDQADDLMGASINGLQIGIIPPIVGSHIDALGAANTLVEFTMPDLAIMALLAGELDGVLAPNPNLFARSRSAGFDSRVKFLDPPVRDVERFVILHESRADLLPAINEAIAGMVADGRLAKLRAKYFIDLPEPVPDVLRVAVANAPPWLTLDGDVPSGYVADVVNALAARAGLTVDYVPMSLEAYFQAATTAGEDMIPLVLVAEGMGDVLDLTLPIESIQLDLLVREDDNQFQALSDLAEARIGTFPDTRLVARENALEVGEIVAIDDFDGLVAALNAGEIDAILETSSGLEGEGITAQFRSIGSPGFEVENAIGLRPGLGSVRERLDAVIPGYLLSSEFAAVRQQYFGEPVFWTPARINIVLWTAGAIFSALIGLLFWLRHRQRQREFQLQQKELEREQVHSRQLGGVIAQLEKANREQAEFTYAISHDLKSPANTVGMLIDELSEMAELGDDGRSVLADMKMTNRHMRQLVDDVLEYSRLVGQEMAVETIDLKALIDEVCKDLAADISKASAKVSAAAVPEMSGNRMQLRMLFQNLISNSIKFRSPDRAPKVDISSRQLPDGLHITVADNGIGIPEEHHNRVFGLFQRLNLQSAYEGTGLGLTICQRVMSNHRGQIAIAQGSEGGTAFTLTFPGDFK